MEVAMNRIIRSSLRLLDRLAEPKTVHAHCDIPCGIYDPHLAQIAALSCIRMNQLIADLQAPSANMSKEESEKFHNSLSRYVVVKEEHAELVKREVRVIWGDYFKPEHVDKYPDLHKSVFNIMKTASKVRQNVDKQAGEDLLAEVQKFAEIFWETKGVKTKKQPSNQAVGGELVVPA
jgi:nickel superoxide dismutase